MALDSNIQLLTKRFLDTRDAYVTGYFYVTIDSIPQRFVKFMKSNYVGNWNEDKIIETFTYLTQSVSLPQETLKTSGMPGRAGFNRTSPLFSEKANTISLTFLVDQKLEASILINGWFDYMTQVADGRLDAGYSKSSTNIFACNFYYCTLLPNMRDVVFAFVGEGLYPLSNATNDFGHSTEETQGLKHTIQFNIDYYDTWFKGKKDMNWLNVMLKEKVDKALGIVKAEEDNEYQLQLKFENEEPTHFGQFNEDRYGNPKTSPRDGSVYDKFQYRYEEE